MSNADQFHICGTCEHYRSFEEQVGCGYVLVEYCARHSKMPCGYCRTACADYSADENYIEFLTEANK